MAETSRNTKRARQGDVGQEDYWSLLPFLAFLTFGSLLLKAAGAQIDELPSAPSSFVIKPVAAHQRTEYMEALL